MTKDEDAPRAQSEERGPLDRALLPFAPLLYVAWADGELAEAEAARIRERLAEADVDEHVVRAVTRWLEPDRPPTADVLDALLSDVRRAAGHLPADEQLTLLALGRALARTHEDEPDERTLRAVAIIEQALGVPGGEAARAMLADAGPARTPAAAELADQKPAVEALARVLGGPQRAERQRTLARLAQPDFEHIPADTPRPEQRARILAWSRTLADEGFSAVPFPREFGGDHDVERSMAVYRALGNHDLSLFTKYGVQFGLFAGSVFQLGTRAHHARFLRDALSLALPGCFAMTETAHGSNVRDIETTARFDRDTGEFVVHTPHIDARKDYIGNAALHGRMATVFAQLETNGTSHGVHAFVVPIRDADSNVMPGVHIEDCGHKAGLNGVDNGRIRFDHVRIPRDHLLDRFGSVDAHGNYSSPIGSPGRRFFTMLGTLVGGRIAVAGAAASATQTGLVIAVRYASTRRQFGPEGGEEVPILDYLSVQRRLLPALATTCAIELALHDLAATYAASDSESMMRVETLAAGIKAYASDHAVTTLQAAREVCGGQGYMAENRLGTLRADVDVFTTFEGANAVLLQLVVKALLGDYRAQFGELRPWSIVRYLAARTAGAVAARNPISSRRTDEDHLRDEDVQRAALEYREQRLLGSLARRMKALIDDGQDAFAALNACQDHALHFARAHVECVLFEHLARATADGDPAELEPVRSLFALAAIEADSGWFLEAGYMEGVKTRAVRASVNRLCGLLRPRAVQIVNAFELPDPVVGAPIAL